MSPIQFVEKAAELGAEVVQICDNLPIDILPERELLSIASHAEELGIVLEIGIRGSSPEYLRRSLSVAKKLGSRLLRVVLTTDIWNPQFTELITIFKSLLPEIHDSGITIAIENHFNLLPDELVQLIETIDDPLVGVCLDPLNSISKLVCPQEVISLLAPYTVSVHAKDAVSSRLNTGFYITGCLLGEGFIDLPGMLKEIRVHGQDPNVLVESWMDRKRDETSTLAQEEAWVRHGIAYLRKLSE